MKSIVFFILIIIFIYLYFNNCKENYEVIAPLNNKSLKELNNDLLIYLMRDNKQVIIWKRERKITYLSLNSTDALKKIKKDFGTDGLKQFIQETREIINAIDLRLNETTQLLSDPDIKRAWMLKSFIHEFFKTPISNPRRSRRG